MTMNVTICFHRDEYLSGVYDGRNKALKVEQCSHRLKYRGASEQFTNYSKDIDIGAEKGIPGHVLSLIDTMPITLSRYSG